MDIVGSGSCTVADFGINRVQPRDPLTRGSVIIVSEVIIIIRYLFVYAIY